MSDVTGNADRTISPFPNLHRPEQSPYYNSMDSVKDNEGSSSLVAVLEDNDEEIEAPPTTCADRLKNPKIWAVLFLLGLLIFIVIDEFTSGYVKGIREDFLQFVEDLGFWGAVLFAIVYIVATVFLIPGTILTLGAGFIFTQTTGSQVAGTFIATGVVFIGASIGATLAFLIGRFLLNEYTTELTKKYKTFRAINKAIETNGLKIVFLLRLSPVIPFNVLNYILGTTAVSLKAYITALIGLLPGTMAFCFIGSTLSSVTESESTEEEDDEDGSSGTVRLVVLIVGLIATVIAVVLITLFAKKELAKALKEEEDAENNEGSNTTSPASTSEQPYETLT